MAFTENVQIWSTIMGTFGTTYAIRAKSRVVMVVSSSVHISQETVRLPIYLI